MLDATGFLGRLPQDPAAKGALGGVGALAGIAYWAYQKYQGRQDGQAAAVGANAQPAACSVSAPPAGGAFLPGPNDTAACNALALKLVRAMIAAARPTRGPKESGAADAGRAA